MKNKAGSKAKKWVKSLCLAFACVFLSTNIATPLAAKADSRAFDEGELRIAFIYKIVYHVSWPKEFDGHVNFCAAGDSKAANYLNLIAGKRVTPTATARVINPGNSEHLPCHVQILGATAGTTRPWDDDSEPTLVICDGCSQDNNPSAVELIKVKDRIGFVLDLEEAKRQNIQFKVSLIELAQQVKGVDSAP